MATRGKRRVKRRRGRVTRALPAILVALLIVGGLFGWMRLSASVVHVRKAEVYLPDLPEPFDGATILYISDLNIRGAADASSCERLMRRLSVLSPDMLLLGGDYSAAGFIDALNQSPGDGEAHAVNFLQSLSTFQAPLGKYAVLGEADDAEALAGAMRSGGIMLLRDAGAYVERDGAHIALVGLRDVREEATDYDRIARSFRSGECVIALAHNPLAYTRIRMAEASGGGAWADLVLSGHTLGGQIKLFGRTLRPFTEEESRRIGGWYYGDDLPALVSQGLGCREVRLRLGTQSEVWQLTLRRPLWQGAVQ